MIEAISQVTPITQPEPQKRTAAAAAEQFKLALRDALAKVNEQQIEASELHKQLAAGRAESLHEVMVAAEKASLTLQLALQVRNKAVEAYQETMRMQI